MGRSPRILRVVTRLHVGGPARQVLSLTRDLAGHGFQTRLVWGSSGPGAGELSPPDDLPATHLPWLTRELNPAGDLRALHALHGVMRRWRPLVVHTHLAKAGG